MRKNSLKLRDKLSKCSALKIGMLSCFICTIPISTNATMASTTSLTKEVDILQQAKYTVKGVVSEQDGNPLIGVSVVEVGSTTNATITDIDGNYSINLSSPTSSIEFRYIGFQTKMVSVGNKTTLDVVLDDDAKMLEQVVVVGFGTQKKVNLTGAVTSVDSKDLNARPINSALEALQGVVPGLNISVGNDGGQLDSSRSFNIRGTGTIGSGSSTTPLVLIDGMEGDINTINPQDIENISVLKDAAAASIYGSRAPGGVILITTKKGSSGKMRINYNNNFRFSNALNTPDMANAYDFALFFNDAQPNGVMFSDTKLQNIKDYMDGTRKEYMYANPNSGKWEVWDELEILPNANTDWYDVHYGSGFVQEHSLSLNGGSDKIQYYLSGNYLDQDGLLNYGKDQRQRYSLNAKINVQLAENLDLSYNYRFVRSDYDAPSYLNGLFFHNIARYWPIIPTVDPNGYYTEESKIYQMENGGRYKSQRDVSFNQLALVYEPIKNLKLNAQLNYRIDNNIAHTDWLTTYAYKVDETPYVSDNNTSSVRENVVKNNFFNPNFFADYSWTLNEKHSFKVMGGYQSELYKTRNVVAKQDGLMAGIPTLNTATTNPLTSGGYANWSTMGVFGRLNYDYQEKYLLEANVRYDGTSRFLKDNRWNVFPSFSAGWNIARESFWEPYSEYVNMFKIRGSWGELGNQNTENWYPFYRVVNTNQNAGNWLLNGKKPNTSSEGALVSSSLTWEKIRNWNIGLDFAALNNRLSATFDYFQRSTLDMVGPAPELPVVLGTAVPRTNNLDMVSKGVELMISWRDVIGDFRYGAAFTLSDSQVEITRYPNPSKDIAQKYYDGAMLGEIWGYTTIGIAKTDEEMQAHLAKVDQSALGTGWKAGDIMYADLDGDGFVNSGENTVDKPGDRKIIGNSNPRYNFGLNLDGAWKGFDIKIFFQGVLKRDYMVDGPLFWGADGGKWQSVAFNPHLDYFRNDENHPLGLNLDSYYPAPNWDSDKNRKGQTGYLQDASYIRLKNLTLGYTLPNSISQKANISNLRFFISGENLLTITDLTDLFDPEVVSSGEWGSGKLYPLSKTFSFGLSLTF